jgi:hypothetical protein
VPAPKRSPDQVEKDRVELIRRYLQGETQQAIADSLGVSQGQIAYDLKIIRGRWLESMLRDFDELKSEQLAKIDLMESEAWSAWEKSKLPKITKSRKSASTPGGSIQEHVDKTEEREGNKVFLDIIDRCVLRRCAIIGIDAEIKYQDINQAIAAVVKAGYEVRSPIEESVPENEKSLGGEALNEENVK